ncbi:hypothetical protein HWV62_17776 [Athelia sp. TMB]|nr:hypothetical protein HWV62_17776 [Athelia sp. TMB]
MGIMRTRDKEWEETKLAVKSGLDVTAKNGSPSGSSRFRTWFKKKIIPDLRPQKMEIVLDIDEAACSVGRQVKSPVVDKMLPLLPGESLEHTNHVPKMPLSAEMQTHLVALITASSDIGSIEDCMTIADQFIATAERSLARAERIAQRALASRASAVQHLRISPEHSRPSTPLDAKYLLPPRSLHTFPDRSASPISLCSADSTPSVSRRTSCISLVPTAAAHDDEDTRALRKLLLRKINTRLDCAFDEIDKATMWLRIVREVVRVVMFRAGL